MTLFTQSDFFLPAVDPAVEQLHQATALYTRRAIVEQVLDLAGWPDADGTIGDTGAGDGVFAEAAIARLALGPNDVATLARRVVAWEIHPIAAQAARERIVAHLLGRGWHRAAAEDGAGRVVIEDDFLAPTYTRRRLACVAANPPYIRSANLPEVFKRRYAELVPDYAQADLLHAFMDRCVAMLTPTGTAALITSDRWLFNASSARLREQLGQRVGLTHLSRLDVASAFYRPKDRRKGTAPRVHPVLVAFARAAVATRALTRAPIYPDAPEEAPAGTVPLGSVAEVRLAPWLGPMGVFVLNREEATHLPPECLVPCVDTDDVITDGEGETVGTPRRVAIRTGRETPPAAVLEHLARTIHELPDRARRTPHWLPAEAWGALPLAREALLIPRIAKGLRLVRLPAGVLPVNHGLTVVSSTLPLRTLIEMLSTDEVAAWLAARAPRLENGYRSFLTGDLRRLPVRLPAGMTLDRPVVEPREAFGAEALDRELDEALDEAA